MTGKALIVGCGDLGLRCARRLHESGYQVSGARRNTNLLPGWLTAVQLDVTQPSSFKGIAGEDWDLVIIALTASGEAQYRSVYIDGLQNLLRNLQGDPLLLFASSTSVYAQSHGEWVDEESPTTPAGYSGRVMLEAETLLAESRFTTVSIRLSGLYGGERSSHLLDVLKRGSICPSSPERISNRIHIEDAARLFIHLARRHFSGAKLESLYLAADSEPAPLREVMEWLAVQNQVDVATLRPDYEPRRGGNRRCDNRRVLETGFEFLYDNFRKGFAATAMP